MRERRDEKEVYCASEDAVLRTSDPGHPHFYDGCEPHYSHEFAGTRFSVVLSFHSGAGELPRAEKGRSESSGYRSCDDDRPADDRVSAHANAHRGTHLVCEERKTMAAGAVTHLLPASTVYDR